MIVKIKLGLKFVRVYVEDIQIIKWSEDFDGPFTPAKITTSIGYKASDIVSLVERLALAQKLAIQLDNELTNVYQLHQSSPIAWNGQELVIPQVEIAQ